MGTNQSINYITMKAKELKALLEGVEDNTNVVIADCEDAILQIVGGGEMSYGGIVLRTRQEFPDTWFRDGLEVHWIDGAGVIVKYVEETEDIEVISKEFFGDEKEHNFCLTFYDGWAEGEGLRMEYPKLADLTDDMIEEINTYTGGQITDSGYVGQRDVCLLYGKVVSYSSPNKSIRDLINDVDTTFKKDDIKSAPREVLEKTILHLYDGLNKINGTYPDWWDREN